jgi:poly(3-hydroxybutyrate) depolymerase
MRVRLANRATWRRVFLCAAVAATAMVQLAVQPAHAYPSDLGGGTVYHRDYSWSFPSTAGAVATSGSNDYIVYTPSGWTPKKRLPLYVLLHGCPGIPGQGAEAMMQATRMNPIADSQRFVVLYPDNHASCWHASSPGREHSVRGGGGDADIVAGMTREVMSAYNVDTERVYLMGFSSGSSQASATAYAYPDLYAAVGVNAGSGPNMDTTCNALADDTAPFFAQSTVEQMGIRARPMPFFGIGGDGLLGGEEDFGGWVDPTGLHPKVSGCTRIAYLEALAIDEQLLPGHTFETSYERTGAVTKAEDGTPVTGVPYKQQVALDGNGCPIAENWIVGTGHKWMGGSTDPEYAKYGINDVNAPSGGASSWAFFRQFTLHGGNAACHPTAPTTAPVPQKGPYSAAASASLVTGNALNVPGQIRTTQFDVAPVSATVDSAATGTRPKAVASARNLTLSDGAFGVNPDLLMEARQAAPTSDSSPVHRQLAAVPAAPYLNADLATADANARWKANPACVTDGPIAQAKSSLANAQVEPYGASDDGSAWKGSLVGMDSYIAPSGTATSTSSIALARHTNDARYSVDTIATTQVSGINVYDAAYIDVVAAPTAEVVATGVPGTARAVVTQPVLRVQGATLVAGRTFTTSVPGGPVIEITPGRITTNVSANGTTAIATGTLAHVKVLDVTGTVTLADVTIGNIAATATVPVGGVTCPRTTAQATSTSTR